MHDSQVAPAPPVDSTHAPAAPNPAHGLAALARRGARQFIGVGLLVWIPMAVAAALTGAFGRLPPAIIPVFVFGFTALLVVWHRRSAALRAFAASVPLAVPVLFHGIRALIGVDFLRLYAADVLPGEFAIHAGVGDIVAGLGALLVLLPMTRARRRRVLWAWNVVAVVDIATVVVGAQLVVLSGDTLLRAAFSTAPYGAIPFLLVPVFATHLLIFQRLRTESHGA